MLLRLVFATISALSHLSGHTLARGSGDALHSSLRFFAQNDQSVRWLGRGECVCLTLAEGQEILCAFHRLAQAPKKFLKILVALDEVDVRRVDHQEIRSGVAEEEM